MERSVEIFDSTLRDGAQGEGISFSVEDKLAVTRLLDGTIWTDNSPLKTAG